MSRQGRIWRDFDDHGFNHGVSGAFSCLWELPDKQIAASCTFGFKLVDFGAVKISDSSGKHHPPPRHDSHVRDRQIRIMDEKPAVTLPSRPQGAVSGNFSGIRDQHLEPTLAQGTVTVAFGRRVLGPSRAGS